MSLAGTRMALDHSILINLFIKVGLSIFSPASPAKYCFCLRVFNVPCGGLERRASEFVEHLEE